MNKIWVSFMLLAPSWGLAAQLPERAAVDQEKGLEQAAGKAQSLLKLNGDERVLLQVGQSTLEWEIGNFRALLHVYEESNPKMGIQGGWNNRVFALQKNGPAARAGIMLGDRIVRVNGQDAEGLPGGIGALAAMINPVALAVERAGQPEPLTFVVLKQPSFLPRGFLKEYDKRLKALKSRAKKLGRRIGRGDSKNREAMENLGNELTLLQAEFEAIKRDAFAALGYETLPSIKSRG